ncbi:MAG: replicative DNA helicase [Planctomycetota bacterium]|nr:MAG: replicative DNA helicase [Planctomycetota bacterium]
METVEQPLHEKRVPVSLEAEKCVLGSVLLDCSVAESAILILEEQYFFYLPHREIFSAIKSYVEKGEPVDSFILAQHLEKRHLLEKVGGSAYINHLLEVVPTAAHCEYYAKIVREKYLLRALLASCTEISKYALDTSDEAEKVIDFAEKKFFELTQKRKVGEAYPIRQILKQALNEIQDIQNGEVSGIPTGFHDLDRMINGLGKSQLIVLAGRPSMGKTSLALNILKNALAEGAKALFFSLEMAKEDIAKNMLCSIAKVPAHRMRGGFLDKDEMKKITQAASTLSKYPFFIVDNPGLSPLEIRAIARKKKAQEDGLNLIVLDYLQLVQAKAENRQQEIALISRSLKALARELEVPVLVLSQLNRAVEAREGSRPKMSDLRESGAIEQDADVVILLYREEYYYPEKEEVKNQAELIIAKQRNGPTGTVKLFFDGMTMSFMNLYSQTNAPA